MNDNNRTKKNKQSAGVFAAMITPIIVVAAMTPIFARGSVVSIAIAGVAIVVAAVIAAIGWRRVKNGAKE